MVEGIPLTNICDSLSNLKSIEGRMEIIDENQDFLVIVDYAHTPDALENVSLQLASFQKVKLLLFSVVVEIETQKTIYNGRNCWKL